MGEVYGLLRWANEGSTRGMRNRPLDAVLLRRDGGNQNLPPGGWAAPEAHERVLRSVIWAALPDRGPTGPAFLEWGGGAPHHGCGRQQLAPPGLAQRPHPLALLPAQPATATAPAATQAAGQVTAQTADARGWGGVFGPPTHAPPTIRRAGGARATSCGREGGDNERRGGTYCPTARYR